jgi:hypothetical protein
MHLVATGTVVASVGETEVVREKRAQENVR